MHCKVYLSPGIGAVVGSANLSKAALNDTLDEDGISGQDEAAVHVTAASMVENVQQWFRNLWRHPETRPISRGDLNVAKKAYEKAKAAQRKNSQDGRVESNGSIPSIPKSFHPDVLSYAKRVRGLDLRTDLGEAHDFVSSIEPSKLTSDEREALVDYVAAWTGHPSAYKRFLTEPISKARTGLELLFDNSANPQSRLEQIQEQSYLPGFKMRSMSVVLYWRQPDHFLPYNFRTVKFLARFGLRSRGMSASSPKCYLTWLAWATRVGQRLGLPSVGYVDRIVDRWYSDQGDAE